MITQQEHDKIAATSEARFRAAFGKGTEGLSGLFVGQSAGCPECGTVDPDEPVGATWFSWRACHVCGTTLGGDRCAAHGYNEWDERVHLDVCTDCAMFIANAEVPSFWQAHPRDGLQG